MYNFYVLISQDNLIINKQKMHFEIQICPYH